MAAAQSALASGDYATALDRAIAAQGYLAALPDSMHAERQLRWTAEKIQNFIDNLRERRSESQAATYGIQRTKLVHAKPSASS